MERPAQEQRSVSGNQFGDGTTIHQSNIYHSRPHSAARAAVRIIPYPRNEDVVYRPDLVTKLNTLLPQAQEHYSAALWGLGGSG